MFSRELNQASSDPVLRARLRPWGIALLALLAVGSPKGVGAERPDAQLPPAASRSVDFSRDVRPLLERHCWECHGPARSKSDLRLDSRAAALMGGQELGPAIKPGDGAGSPIVQLAAGLVPGKEMPAKGDRLSPGQIGLLRAWIDQGAVWPEETAASDPAKSHWAFRPVERPAIPAGPAPLPPAGNPVDAFIRQRLAEAGLSPSPAADRPTLIRRLYLVMLGLPPTPEEVRQFREDPRPDAWERLVDRVLDDPRYGERWARHWLDVIRFAETNGYETNRERPNGWRFRDYVIAALNANLPYDQFVREQIAGDQFGADVATGFLVGGPWDIVKSPDPVLTAQQRADELDDMVNTVGTAFLGVTLGCARCHSHKFDPISQREYYSVAALVAGVQQGERALSRTPDQEARLRELDARIQDLEKRLARFIPATPAPTAGLLPPVNARWNEDRFPPVEARFLRFDIRASSGGEPGLDEVEVWSGERNVALASLGTRATASGTLPGYEIHQLRHLNDGKAGNDRSWISNEAGRGWVQLEFPRPERIERVTWGRDREERFKDRVPTGYRIEVSLDGKQWAVVSDSDRRQPFKGGEAGPKGPVYRFEGFAEAEAREGRGWLAELEGARKQREAAARSPMIHAGTFSQPPAVHRLHRGDPMQPREVVAPGTLGLFAPVAVDPAVPETERRRRLAEWITRPDHPLTPRVIVNRVWQHHFGVGLVDTPNDFGRNGSRPSHPALLDWLATELVHPSRGGRAWSLKSLHRLLLTSATWRQSGAPRPEGLAADAGNRLLWRFGPRRLEAEAIRDCLLEVSGNLDRTAGGPPFYLHQIDRENVYHYHPKEEFGPAESRRMIYALKVRMEQDAIFGAFDCPDGSLVMPRRSVSTTPLQALNLFNSRFVMAQAEILAGRLRREAGDRAEAQVKRAWQLAFGRDPDPPEAGEAVAFLGERGLPALCRAVLNANELLFIP